MATQTDTIRQTDGPLVPVVGLVPVEKDVIPMVLLVNIHLIKGDFRKKFPIPADWFQAGKNKNLQGNTCHKMALYVREKNISPEVSEKNNLTQTNSPIPPPPRSQKSDGRPLIWVDQN